MQYKGLIDYRWRIRRRMLIGILIGIGFFAVDIILVRAMHTNIPTYDPGIVYVKLIIAVVLGFLSGFVSRAVHMDNLDANILKSGPAERERLISILEESLEVDDAEDFRNGKKSV